VGLALAGQGQGSTLTKSSEGEPRCLGLEGGLVATSEVADSQVDLNLTNHRLGPVAKVQRPARGKRGEEKKY